MNKENIPFVGLHAHSVAGSIFDGLGYPQEHMDFAYENGMDALALTDHGNMNGLAWQVLHAKKMQAEGKNFKPIFGVEAYFLPSLDEWRDQYEKAKSEKKNINLIETAESITAGMFGASPGKSAGRGKVSSSKKKASKRKPPQKESRQLKKSRKTARTAARPPRRP